MVLSDTHGNVAPLIKVMNWARDRLPPNDSICAATFLGDGISDLHKAVDATGFFCDWKLVCGNNDYGHLTPESVVFDFCGYRFFMCHGHRHGVYVSYHSLVTAAQSNEANVVLFGHAHVPFYKTVEGILLLNPGSVGRPRSRIGATFAVIECIEGEPLKTEFFRIGEQEDVWQVELP